jgi:hypothetical protein
MVQVNPKKERHSIANLPETANFLEPTCSFNALTIKHMYSLYHALAFGRPSRRLAFLNYHGYFCPRPLHVKIPPFEVGVIKAALGGSSALKILRIQHDLQLHEHVRGK